jgi:hypothetical protein
LGVSKAYDDDLYAYGVGRFPEEFDGLKIKHIEVEKVETLEGATLQLRARARGSSQGGPRGVIAYISPAKTRLF